MLFACKTTSIGLVVVTVPETLFLITFIRKQSDVLSEKPDLHPVIKLNTLQIYRGFNTSLHMFDRLSWHLLDKRLIHGAICVKAGKTQQVPLPCFLVSFSGYGWL